MSGRRPLHRAVAAFATTGVWILSGCGTVQLGATWQGLPIAFDRSPTDPSAWIVGGDGPNPVATLPIDAVRGRWVRFSVAAASRDSGIGVGIVASSTDGPTDPRRTRSIPALCDDRPADSRCATLFWVPVDATRVRVAIWADRRPGAITAPRIEWATFPRGDRTIADGADALLAQISGAYYRTDDVDWVALRRVVSAMPSPPEDVDPLPAIAEYVRSRLPGNQHMYVWKQSTLRAPAATVAMPTCGSAGHGIGVLTMPGLSQTDGDAPAAYTAQLHDCLMDHRPARAWVVDLRGNGGGNMYPMLAGLAPLLPIGPLYAFANGHRDTTARIAIDARGLTVNGELVTPASDPAALADRPVLVVFDGRCASSCEQVANALSASRWTRSIGQPSAGFLTANVILPIDRDYVLLLTSGYTEDPCGRVLDGNLVPDLRVDDVTAKPVDALLAEPAVRAWLGVTSPDSATRRCGG